MNNNQQLLLPGGIEQFNLLKKNFGLKDKIILMLGFGTLPLALQMSAQAKDVIIAVSSNDELMATRLKLQGEAKLSVRLMAFDLTDFSDEAIDIVYAQGSISNEIRNKILKEIKRILKPEGVLCVGEITSLREEAPQFVKDIWQRSGLMSLFVEELEQTYTERGFKILFSKDLNHTLLPYYREADSLIKKGVKSLHPDEYQYQRKHITRLQHEVNAYLKLGANKYIGFKTMLVQKVVDEKE